MGIPPGLQMLAGDHMGTAPNPHVNFLCPGGIHNNDAETCRRKQPRCVVATQYLRAFS